MKKYIWMTLGLTLSLFASCDLDETPQATATEDDIFTSENGLQTYVYSFYNGITSRSDAFKGDVMADYGAVNNLNNFLIDGAYSAENSNGWDWEDDWSKLRNINYFIEKCNRPEVSEEVRNNYIGIARFFRAWFYYDKVTRFGDMPWIEKALTPNDSALLYADRDPRTLVMDKVMEDLDFAAEHILAEESDGTTVTKWTALGLKSRIALFEGTFRKYHTELGLVETADAFLQQAADAAEQVMTRSPHHLNALQGVEESQRALFISDAPVTSEVLFAIAFNKDLAILNDANWWWTSATYGPRYSLVRPFINTILNVDGTPYTDRSDYKTETFYEECQDRDYRLAQLIRTPGYTRNGVATPPNFASHTYTGYQPIKYTLDDPYYDDGAYNTNAVPLMRYAEILLNYAEAKAELDDLSDADWKNTVGALRARAGVTGGLDVLPTQVDPYLQQTFFPGLTDPVLLEIRRERQVELALEGFRFNDLKRWKRGELMADLEWTGMYVPALDELIDLDHDGKYDVVFYDGGKEGPSIEVPKGLARVAVGGPSTNFQTLTDDHHLEWFKAQKRTWSEDDRQYYYPIPATAITKNTNLTQNPHWE